MVYHTSYASIGLIATMYFCSDGDAWPIFSIGTVNK